MHGTFQTISARAAALVTKPVSPMPYLRIAALQRAIVDRFGEARLPDSDEGRDILRPVADHLAQINPARIRPWAAAWMPGLPAAEIDDLIASREALIAECGKTALYWNADALAHEVELDDAARTRTRAWTIGAVDCDKAEREERRKITRAAAGRARRAAAGATLRAQSITATKPWIADGFNSRRTWERHGKKPRVANARPAILSSPSMSVTNLRHASRSAAEGRPAEPEPSLLPENQITYNEHTSSGAIEDRGTATEGREHLPCVEIEESAEYGMRVEADTKTPVTTTPEGTYCGKPTTSTGRLPCSRIDGDGARDEAQMIPLTEFARLRLVALSANAVESECPALWSDVREAAAEWQDTKREVAAGETAFVAMPEGAPASEWHPTRATVVVAMTWRRSFPCRLAA